MANVLDIRESKGPVTEIRVADHDNSFYTVELIRPVEGRGIDLMDGSRGVRILEVRDCEHLDNLMLALNKAKELGWV